MSNRKGPFDYACSTEATFGDHAVVDKVHNDNEYMSPEQVAAHMAKSIRELVACKLEAEILDPNAGDETERAFRRGWNSRAESMVRELRAETKA